MAQRSRLASGAGLWSLVFVVVTLGQQWLPGAAEHWKFVRTAYGAGAWWQLLTAQAVHLSTVHAGVNALGLVVLLLVFRGLVAGRLQALALLGGYAGVALVLALDPDCVFYAGASGALHGLLAGSACALLLAPPPRPLMPRARLQILGGCVLLGLAAKLLVQHFGGYGSSPGWLGFATYYPAHEAGAVGGLVAVLLARMFQRQAPARPGTGA
ncbi:MAG: rhombosortase [Pseudomonadota bacterium]